VIGLFEFSRALAICSEVVREKCESMRASHDLLYLLSIGFVGCQKAVVQCKSKPKALGADIYCKQQHSRFHFSVSENYLFYVGENLGKHRCAGLADGLSGLSGSSG
jgi:hypothetical protein